MGKISSFDQQPLNSLNVETRYSKARDKHMNSPVPAVGMSASDIDAGTDGVEIPDLMVDMNPGKNGNLFTSIFNIGK